MKADGIEESQLIMSSEMASSIEINQIYIFDFGPIFKGDRMNQIKFAQSRAGDFNQSAQIERLYIADMELLENRKYFGLFDSKMKFLILERH